MSLEFSKGVMKMCGDKSSPQLRKIPFHAKEGIVLGHKVSIQGIKVDHAKIEPIEKLPPPTLIKII